MNFKHLFLTTLFAASFGLVACDNSSSADSSDDNSNKKSTEKKTGRHFKYGIGVLCGFYNE